MRQSGDDPTPDELDRRFDAALADAVAGDGVISCSGLDACVERALMEINIAAPEFRADLIAAARECFAGQLNGSNAQRSGISREYRELYGNRGRP